MGSRKISMTHDDRNEEIFRTLQYLSAPGRVIEIRIIGEDGISSGYFDDFKRATTDLLERETDTHVSGVYVTLNEVNKALLARRANRIKYRLGKNDSSTGDGDITRRWWLPIDLDPVRPAGVSSSNEEHARALTLARTIQEFLTAIGWPDPLIADSGNGAHLLYPIDLPNDDASKIQIRSVLELLDTRFSHAGCKVDTANFNASRIWKIYGTTSRKGDNLADRPHRRSRILTAPSVSRRLSGTDLKNLLNRYQESEISRGHINTDTNITPDTSIAVADSSLDLGAWLKSYHLSATSKPYQGGTLYVLDECPFSDAHKDGAFAIQFANGAIFAGCHHNSCGSGKQRWPELRSRYEKNDIGSRLARLRSGRIRAQYAAEHDEPDDFTTEPRYQTLSDREPEQYSDRIVAQADEILSSGDPFAFMRNIFGKYHEGDQQVAQCLIHSLVSRTVLNSKGLHVSISGESGKGKSHAIDTMRNLVPPAFRIEGRVSDKALFYMENLQPGTVITLDDVSLSDQMQEVLKGVTTSFQKPFPYRTVNKDRKPQVCMIPERCVWWIAKVEGAGDDQVFNRMLTCWIDDTEEQDRKVLDRTLASAEEMPDATCDVNEEVMVCRQIWNDLKPVWVVIPFARRIRFQSAENRRNPDMFLDLIRTSAAICQRQREVRIIQDITCVIATEQDFRQAASLFVALNGETGGQDNKLTKRESALIKALSSFGSVEVTVAELQQVTGWTSSSVSKLLHGYLSYGKVYSGILDKCPAVSFLERSVTRGNEGETTYRRARVYIWDPELYAAWMKGGSIWLAGEDSEDSDLPPDSSDGDDSTLSSGDVPDTRDSSAHERGQNSLARDDSSGTTRSSTRTGCSLSSITSRDFIKIEGFPDRSRCCICGKRPTWYRHRDDTTQGQDQEVRKICEVCYHQAVSREAAAIIPLPGVIDTAAMIHRDTPTGRCQVCSLRPATWSDPNGRITICEVCYQRELGYPTRKKAR
ncbi:MAG: hypothetical protein LUQ50_04465 [Methanospirillum sp.]|uniref:hypothetical protein n=1 Tax=Methanospirillum sp. TaxID=45200 RepID=UPI002370449D|nr:hypothetical protein [Methanospirillum sp.]MDD1728309.1 hypothetical protein [Methanospirillum sp.]